MTERRVLILGDCLDRMGHMDADSIDAIVTDPPYGLAFMGKGWDSFYIKQRTAQRDGSGPTAARIASGRSKSAGLGPSAAAGGMYDRSPSGQAGFQRSSEAWAREALRIAKPGAHLLAFGGTRTFHRLTCAIEDAGWEIRDSIGNIGLLGWVYGSGFPKSLDVSKAIDKEAGAERETTGVRVDSDGRCRATEPHGATTYQRDTCYGQDNRPGMAIKAATIPATDAARRWEGWGTALKPAWEPIVMARKPLVGTVAKNVRRYGTGGINVDGCRIGTSKRVPGSMPLDRSGKGIYGAFAVHDGGPGQDPDVGRWPANLCLDEEAAAMLDEQSGISKSTQARQSAGFRDEAPVYGGGHSVERLSGANDSGGASRFFYVAKASRGERQEGLEGEAANRHPTVKPVSLMRWLVRLVTPPGGVVLDPFMGSGTTGIAAHLEGCRFVGIEKERGYFDTAAARIDACTRQSGLFDAL